MGRFLSRVRFMLRNEYGRAATKEADTGAGTPSRRQADRSETGQQTTATRTRNQTRQAK